MERRNVIPIIRIRNCLLVSIQVDLSDALVDTLKRDVARVIREQPISGLIVEVSGVDVFDSYIARAIRDLAHVARLMGAHTVLAGLDPDMALTLVEMAMQMDGVGTALNLDDALDLVATSEATHLAETERLLDELGEQSDRPGQPQDELGWALGSASAPKERR